MPWEAITTMAVVAGVLLTALIQYSGKSQWQGEVGARLTRNEQDIDELKETKDKQWEAISDHREKIAALQATRGKANGHGII